MKSSTSVWADVTPATKNSYQSVDLGPSGSNLLASGDSGNVKLAWFRVRSATILRYRIESGTEDFGATREASGTLVHIFVPVSANDVCEIYIGSVGTVEFGGYWISSESGNTGTTETNIISGDATAPAAYRQYDLTTSTAADAKVAIIHYGSNTFAAQNLHIRPNGATFDHSGNIGRRSAHSYVVGMDSGQALEIKSAEGDTTWTDGSILCKLTAWITDNVTVVTSNPENLGQTGTAGWKTDVNVTSAVTADIAVNFACFTTNGQNFTRGVRHTDETAAVEHGWVEMRWQDYLALLDGTDNVDLYHQDDRQDYMVVLRFQEAVSAGAARRRRRFGLLGVGS